MAKKANIFATSGARWLANKYGLSHDEALCFAFNPKQAEIIRTVESWRESNGFPAANSPLVRGKLRDLGVCRLPKKR